MLGDVAVLAGGLALGLLHHYLEVSTSPVKYIGVVRKYKRFIHALSVLINN